MVRGPWLLVAALSLGSCSLPEYVYDDDAFARARNASAGADGQGGAPGPGQGGASGAGQGGASAQGGKSTAGSGGNVAGSGGNSSAGSGGSTAAGSGGSSAGSGGDTSAGSGGQAAQGGAGQSSAGAAGTAGDALGGAGQGGAQSGGAGQGGTGPGGDGGSSGQAGAGQSGAGQAGAGQAGAGQSGAGQAGAGQAGSAGAAAGAGGASSGGTSGAAGAGAGGSCAVGPGCAAGSESRKGCGSARTISRLVASLGYVASGDTCAASDATAEYGGSCWDFGRDHTYKILMMEGESLSIIFDPTNKCVDATSWDPVFKIYASGSCDQPAQCPEKLACASTGSGPYIKDFVAPHDGWYFLIIDGRTAPLSFDDSGKYTLDVKLSCKQSGCGC